MLRNPKCFGSRRASQQAVLLDRTMQHRLLLTLRTAAVFLPVSTCSRVCVAGADACHEPHEHVLLPVCLHQTGMCVCCDHHYALYTSARVPDLASVPLTVDVLTAAKNGPLKAALCVHVSPMTFCISGQLHLHCGADCGPDCLHHSSVAEPVHGLGHPQPEAHSTLHQHTAGLLWQGVRGRQG